MMRRDTFRPRYEVVEYRADRGVTTRPLDGNDLAALIVEEYDFLLAPVWGDYGFRDVTGKWRRAALDGAGLGDTTADVLRALQLNAGTFLTPRDIAGLAGKMSLHDSNNLAARIRVIRLALGETGRRPRFVISRRAGGYAVKWVADFSWIWIERIPNADTAA